MLSNAIETAGEWTAAREVQQQFMQQGAPATGESAFSAQCRQAGEVGGDFYQFLPAPGDRVMFSIGDAAGKGVAAALLMASVQGSLRTAIALIGADSREAFAAVNRETYQSSPADRYATLFHGVFDWTTRTLRYVNAGHNPPLVLRQGSPAMWLETGGAPVGMFPDWNYEEGVIDLDPGDIVIAYTDGVIEAVNTDGEEWGVQGLEKAARDNDACSAEEMVRAIFAAMDDHSATLQQRDDATVVVLRV